MDDALTVSRSQTEESQASRMIYSTTGLFRQFIKSVKCIFLNDFQFQLKKGVDTNVGGMFKEK